MRVEFLEVNEEERTLLLRYFGELNLSKFIKNIWKGRLFGFLEPWIKGSSTDEQRKHYWALIGDISNFTGDTQAETSVKMKLLYMVSKDPNREPSMARGKMKLEDAREWLQLIIEHCIENQIPFNHPEGYVPADISRYLYKLTMNRMCVVCGKPHSDIAHFGAVGMGRDRSKVDHTQSKFLCLCREHHQEQHSMGEQTFLEKYHLTPLKLSQHDLKELGVIR